MSKNRYNFYTFQTVPTTCVGEINRQPSVVDETDFRDLKDLIPNLIRYPLYDFCDDGDPNFESEYYDPDDDLTEFDNLKNEYADLQQPKVASETPKKSKKKTTDQEIDQDLIQNESNSD